MAAKPTLVAQPIAQPTNDGALAPWPSIDKYPIVIGPGLSLQYISSIFRLSLIGYRQQYVDLLDELLEKDPHAFSVVSKRVLGVAGGKLEITPAECPGNKRQQKQADKIAVECQAMMAGLPDLEQNLAELAWASYYAIGAQEIHWARDGAGWMPERLSNVHSRRLSYPGAGSWDLYVWDQGQVFPSQFESKTSSAFGLRIADYPGKFIVHAPQIRGNYPTRNGLGRQIAYWMALKLIATRGAPQYLERFAKPWPEATYHTGPEATRRAATEEDIASAKAALNAMGAGSLSSWVHADTVSLDLRTPDNGGTSKLTFAEWIGICDAQISKAGLGGTLTTEVGTTGGNRSLGDTQKRSETMLLKYDARLLATSLRRDLFATMVRLNFPGVPMRLVPQVALHIEDPPDPMSIIERAAKGAQAGMPIDADKMAEAVGLPLVKTGDLTARRMFPIMASKSPELYDADLAARANALRVEPEETDETNGDGAKPDPNDDNQAGDEPADDNGKA